jgi:hypothetical protein
MFGLRREVVTEKYKKAKKRRKKRRIEYFTL